MWILSDCDAYMSKFNWSVLLSGSIHVFMHFLSWIYSNPLVAGWAPAPLWCRFTGRRSLVAVSFWGWLWSLLDYLLFFGVFIESMLLSVTLGIGGSFYFRLYFRILLNLVLVLKLWWDMNLKVFENYSTAMFLIWMKYFWIFLEDVWHACVFLYFKCVFIIKNKMWKLGCYIWRLRNRGKCNHQRDYCGNV